MSKEISILLDEIHEIQGITRLLATMLSDSSAPEGLRFAMADTYSYAKAEVLQSAERVLHNAPKPTTGRCGHCAQSYGTERVLNAARTCRDQCQTPFDMNVGNWNMLMTVLDELE
jgi:hypothetical protein